MAINDIRARSGWTVQLVAGNRQQTVLNLIDRYDSISGIRYTHTERQGKDWFVGFYGDFSSYQEAQEAVAGFPRSLRDQSPWIRQMQDF